MCLVKGRHFNLNSVQNLSELLILVLAVQLEFSLAVILKLRNGLPPFKSLFWYQFWGPVHCPAVLDQRNPHTKQCLALNLV